MLKQNYWGLKTILKLFQKEASTVLLYFFNIYSSLLRLIIKVNIWSRFVHTYVLSLNCNSHFLFISGKGCRFSNMLNYLKSLHDLVDWELFLTVRHWIWFIYEGRKHEEAFWRWSDLWWIRGTESCYVSSIFYFLVLVMLVLVKLDLHACHF